MKFKNTRFLVAVALIFSIHAAYAQCVGNCQNDEGRMVYRDGDIYDGEWSNGKKHGFGTYTFKSGAVFVGEYRDGKRYFGEITYSSGNFYKGPFKDGKRHGFGYYTRLGEGTYHGYFIKNKRNGRGIFTSENGKKTSGIWVGKKLIKSEPVKFDSKEYLQSFDYEERRPWTSKDIEAAHAAANAPYPKINEKALSERLRKPVELDDTLTNPTLAPLPPTNASVSELINRAYIHPAAKSVKLRKKTLGALEMLKEGRSTRQMLILTSYAHTRDALASEGGQYLGKKKAEPYSTTLALAQELKRAEACLSAESGVTEKNKTAAFVVLAAKTDFTAAEYDQFFAARDVTRKKVKRMYAQNSNCEQYQEN